MSDARSRFVTTLEADKHGPPSLREELANLLWEEGKFPGGGARTSRDRCRQIVDAAIVKFVNTQQRGTE